MGGLTWMLRLEIAGLCVEEVRLPVPVLLGDPIAGQSLVLEEIGH